MTLQAPVVLIIFRRPDETRRVFERIRLARPARLYIVGDSARSNRPEEVSAVESCRRIVSEVDWDCEVFTNYPEVNLGLRERVVSGLDWVFTQEDRAIILEDDCVPGDSFFELSAELLERYFDDGRIGGIGGTNIGPNHLGRVESYFFSKYPAIWGWATWKRVWSEYRGQIPEVSTLELEDFDSFSPTPSNKKYWSNKFNDVALGRINTWDYQLAYLFMVKGWLWTIPKNNLISNIGFGPSATHTWNTKSPHSGLSISDLQAPFIHPQKIEANWEFDAWLQKVVHRESSTIKIALRILRFFPEAFRTAVVQVASRLRR